MGQLDKLQQTLRWVDANLHRLTIEQLRDIYGECLPRLPFGIIDFDNRPFYFNQLEYSGTNVVYRAMIIKGDSNEPHEYVKDISYMPSDKLHYIKDYGRVNKPGQAMFYGAFNPVTAAIEVLHANPEFLKKPSALLTIGIWKFAEPLVLTEMLLSQSQHDKMYRELSGIKEFVSKFDKKFFDEQVAWTNKFTDLEQAATEYFAAKFCEYNENNHHYKASNYYADRVFDRYSEHPNSGGTPIEGIIYSSVPNSYQQKNIVLPPEVVDSKLKFFAAEQIIVFGGDSFQIGVIDRAHADDNGKLLWDKREWEKKQERSI